MPFISFEGIGGAGKSTVAKILNREFSQKGKKVFLYKPVTRQRLQRALSAFPGEKEKVWVCHLPYVPPRVEALCYLALLIKDNEEILNHTKTNDLVIFDRYIDSVTTHVAARNNLFGRELIFNDFYSWFRKIYKKEIKLPTKTLVFDINLKMAEERAIKRENKRYTREDKMGFALIQNFYHFLARKEPDRFCFINANKKLKDVVQQVKQVLNNV